MEKNSILKKFNDKMNYQRVRLHGAVLMSGKKVIEELYNPPYTAETITRMYSTSKSVMAVAIGRLIGENKLSLEDKVVDIFANRFDMSSVHPYLKEQTVRDMLKMTTVYSKPTYNASTKNWLESYFTAQPTHPARTVWNYDSCGSYVLGAIVKEKTGLDFVEYLRPVFDEIGVSKGVYSMKGPDGEAWVSSAFMATTADLAKIAYLLLEKGKWNGKQLIPKDYAIDATSPLDRNDDGALNTRFNCGYGYQVWSHPDGAFAFRGLGGQVAIAFPGRDLVFACTSDTAGNRTTYDDIFNAVEDIILPNFPIIDKEQYERAKPKPVTENVFDKIKNKNFILQDNPMKLQSVRFEQSGDTCKLFYKREDKELSIDFSTEKEVQIIFPQKYSGEVLFNPEYDENYKCSVYAEWLTNKKLFIKVWAEDLFVGNMTMCFAFREDGKIGVKMQKNAQFFFDDFNGFAGGEIENN